MTIDGVNYDARICGIFILRSVWVKETRTSKNESELLISVSMLVVILVGCYLLSWSRKTVKVDMIKTSSTYVN